MMDFIRSISGVLTCATPLILVAVIIGLRELFRRPGGRLYSAILLAASALYGIYKLIFVLRLPETSWLELFCYAVVVVGAGLGAYSDFKHRREPALIYGDVSEETSLDSAERRERDDV